MNKRNRDGLFDVPVKAGDPFQETDNNIMGLVSNAEVQNDTSFLGLLALTYSNSSDSDEDDGDAVIHEEVCKTKAHCSLESRSHYPEINCEDEVPLQVTGFSEAQGSPKYMYESRRHESLEHDTCRFFTSIESDNLTDGSRHQIASSNCSSVTYKSVKESTSTASEQFDNKNLSRTTSPDEDSSRMHVFCLQHAVQVEKQLQSIGGAHVLLFCHPDYPKVEAQAKQMAEEFGDDYVRNDISYRQASEEDEEVILVALESEEAIHGNGDWAVKLGINLFYSANLSRSSLYCKQMPYNSIIYNAFGRSSPMNDTTKGDSIGRGPGRQKKMLVAGKWCGKVWMSNQVHPLLTKRDYEEQQRSIPSRTKPDLKVDVKPQRPLKESRFETAETTSMACKTQKKRKPATEIRPVVKAKSAKVEEQQDKAFEASSFSHSLKRGKSNQRKRPTTRENPEPRDKGVKNRKQINLAIKEEQEGGPSSCLRKRPEKPVKDQKAKLAPAKPVLRKPQMGGKAKKSSTGSSNAKLKKEKAEYPCEMEGCTMSFGTKQELVLHKRNICPVKGCGKKFFSHKYLVQHHRVHMDDRPLKCPWKGCKMSFKWAWARTEHIRVHTSARPYVCSEAGCGQTFQFVSDFSRHKRKTGHSTSKKGRG